MMSGMYLTARLHTSANVLLLRSAELAFLHVVHSAEKPLTTWSAASASSRSWRSASIFRSPLPSKAILECCGSSSAHREPASASAPIFGGYVFETDCTPKNQHPIWFLQTANQIASKNTRPNPMLLGQGHV